MIQGQGDGVASTTAKVGNGCCGMEGYIGLLLTWISVVFVTLVIEFVSAIVYGIAVGIYFVLSPLGWLEATLGAVVTIIVTALLLVDAIILLVSIGIAEIFAMITCIVTTLFHFKKPFNSGIAWYYHVRRTNHLCRWAIRTYISTRMSKYAPIRIFPPTPNNAQTSLHQLSYQHSFNTNTNQNQQQQTQNNP